MGTYIDRVVTKKGGTNSAVPFLLKNKLYCGLCGHKMDGESGTSYNGTIINAIEQGIITASTKLRLEELENRRDELIQQIHVEQCKLKNQITREDIIKYLSKTIKKEPRLMIFSLIKKVPT